MDLGPIKEKVGRLVAAGRAQSRALLSRARAAASAFEPRMRALRMAGPAHSPDTFDWLAVNAALGTINSMQKTDLEAVAARRAMVAREIAALEKMREEMEAEDEELAVAERVLRRLAEIPRGDVRERVKEAAATPAPAPAREPTPAPAPAARETAAAQPVFSGAKEKLDGPIRE